MRSWLGGCVAAALALSLFGCQDSHDSAANDLISAFSGACVTSGDWAQLALADSQKITTVIQNLKDNDPCKELQASIGVIQNASQRIGQVLSDDAYKTYRGAEESVQELTLSLRGADSDDLQSALKDALVKAQIELATAKGADQADASVQKKDRYATETQDLATYATQIETEASGNLAACLKQSPSTAIKIASNLMVIGGSFVSPVLGAGAAAIGTLLNLGVDAAHQSDWADALNRIDQNNMPHGLGCALESMSELYCDAVDSQDLLKTAVQSSSLDRPIPDFWKGTDILLKRMPVLDNWLLSIRNGLLPQDSHDADRQNQILKKLNLLDRTFNTVYGILQEQKKSFTAPGISDAQKINILVRTVMNSVTEIETAGGGNCYPGGCNPSDSNPFSELTNDWDTWSCWLMRNPDNAPPKPSPIGNAPPDPEDPKVCPQHSGDLGESYIRDHLATATLDFQKLFDNWDSIRKKVRQNLDFEFTQNITADPKSILAAAKQTQNPKQIVPYEVLRRLVEFLDQQIAMTPMDPNRTEFLQSVRATISKAIATIDSMTLPDAERIQDLFTGFELDHGLQKIDSDIKQIVQWDLATRIKNNEFPSDVNDILMTSDSDIFSRLQAAVGKQEVDPVPYNKDLDDAQTISTGNMRVFRDFFESSLARSVQYLSDSAIYYKETEGGSFHQTLGHLCTMILQSGMEWPGSVSWEICSKASYTGITPDPKHPLEIRVADLAKELDGKDFRTRVCAFHRFLRASKYSAAYSKAYNPKPPVPAWSGDLGFFVY